jgi:hypothetical protein
MDTLTLHLEDVPQTQTCIIHAAAEYQLPAELLLAVAEQERGQPYQKVRNSNGSFDLGPMQFNTTYLKDLAKFKIQPEHVLTETCYPYRLAAWRIKNHLEKDSGPILQRVANYHSKTRRYNLAYQKKLIPKIQRWQSWLTAISKSKDG